MAATVALNVTEAVFAVALTVAGSVIAPLLEDKPASVSLCSACANVTVQVIVPPAATVDGHVKDESASNKKNVRLLEAPPVAVTVTDSPCGICPEVAVNVPVVDPVATVTEAGTVRLGELLASGIDCAEVGAADRVTVQLVELTLGIPEFPPPIDAKLHCSPVSVGEPEGPVIETVAVAVDPSRLAVMVAC